MRKKKATGQLDLFKEIHKERKPLCQVCGRSLIGFSVIWFAHIIPKGTYKKFMLRKKNIALMCPVCHYKYDHQTDKARKDPRFEWVFKLGDQLRRQYERMRQANLFYLLDL